MTSITSFHQNVAFMQSLVIGRGGASETNGTAARNYSIRRCLRDLRQLLMSEDWRLVLRDGQCATDLSIEGHSVPCIAPPDEKPLASHPDYDQVTQDLILLLTMDVDGIGDPSIARIFHESIICRVMDLLDEVPHLGATQLRGLFHHVLNLLDLDHHTFTAGKNNNDDDESSNGNNLQQLLDLMNRHVTNHEHLHAVFSDDHELFVALHTVLYFHEKRACVPNSVPPSIELAIFINSIIEYWVFHCGSTTHDNHSHDEGNSAVPVDHRVNNVHVWVQMQFMQQQKHYHSARELLQQDVDVYVSRVECYGTTLIESTLRMLEDSTSSLIRDEISGHKSNHPGDNDHRPKVTFRSNAEPQHLTDCDDDDLEVTVLKYATLATSFLVAIQKTSLSLTHPVAISTLALSRSLWREYVNFVIRRLSTAAGSWILTMDADDAYSVASNAVDMAHGGSDRLDLSMVATDTLFRLAQYHYPMPPMNRCRRSSNKHDDIPMILVTILGLWKHATTLWNDDTIDWIKHVLQDDFPHTTSSGKELRQGIYCAILSSAYFPSHDTQSYAKGPIDLLTTLFLHDIEEPGEKLLVDESSCSDPGADPWRAWVSSHVSNRVSSSEYGSLSN